VGLETVVRRCCRRRSGVGFNRIRASTDDATAARKISRI
jgi:hypothetical protein